MTTHFPLKRRRRRRTRILLFHMEAIRKSLWIDMTVGPETFTKVEPGYWIRSYEPQLESKWSKPTFVRKVNPDGSMLGITGKKFSVGTIVQTAAPVRR